ncbi:MAG: hypothetical protein C4520_09785 [Candidatus Abyssobacteria bacterium SURF_5]|uniref:YkgJ family cysteine cluster protein n=1 Tax=Abyssobacteria bacterium (strain SURF_5) TaxID=2093360 RepID=A0A3A4NRZ8_ABYX5|nr:MAG: hypothetical protein C4520_09785 [Candidatus Abyssubacteria bacterium SURF_5]
MNDFELKKAFLKKIYHGYEQIVSTLGDWKCKPGCSDCCTSLAVVTTLEAAYLWERMPESLRANGSFMDNAPPLAFTTNEQASLCLSRTDFEEEELKESVARCPLLVDDRCSCYDARPFMCRLMLSSIDCRVSGHAEIPSALLSFNTAVLQILEDLDRDGWSGYLVHQLGHFQQDDLLERYISGEASLDDSRVRRNHANPGLLIPPEHQEQVADWLRKSDIWQCGYAR